MFGSFDGLLSDFSSLISPSLSQKKLSVFFFHVLRSDFVVFLLVRSSCWLSVSCLAVFNGAHVFTGFVGASIRSGSDLGKRLDHREF